MSKPQTPSAAPFEALAVVVVCFGWFILGSVAAVASGFPRGATFSDSSFIELIVMEFVFGALALVLLRARGYPLGRLLPSPSWQGCLAGIAVFLAATILWFTVAQVFPASEYSRQPIADMVSGPKISLPLVIAVSMINGLYEETFLVGYLVQGFRASGPAFAIGVSLLVRVMYHLYQGPIGTVSVLVFGIVVTLFYWRTGKLWPVVFAHTLADAVAFA